jgi:uncharacterized membrane protein
LYLACVYCTLSFLSLSLRFLRTFTVAADNLIVALYFAFLFWRAKDDETALEAAENEEKDSSIELGKLGTSLSTAATLVAGGRLLTKTLLPAGTSSLPVISLLSVGAATAFPKFFSRIADTGLSLGVIFIQMFFAASGAAGSIALVLQKGPRLFAFSAVQIAIHFWTLMTVGKIGFRLPYRELYLASNANIGGPTTAAAMCEAKGWKQLMVPALLVGILGYATATPIALALGPLLMKLAAR